MQRPQRASSECQNQRGRQHASCQADNCHAPRPRRQCGLLLVQLCPLALLQSAERAPDLLHQRVPLVCQFSLAHPAKEVFVAQIDHVLHHLYVPGNYGLDLGHGLQGAGVITQQDFQFIDLRGHSFGRRKEWIEVRLFARNREAASRAFHLAQTRRNFAQLL